MADELPEDFWVPTRDELVASYLRSFRIRARGLGAQTVAQAEIDANVIADVLMPLFGNAKLAALGQDVRTASGSRLRRIAERVGLTPPYRDAVGASGYILPRTIGAGGTIYAGDVILHPDTRKRFRVTVTGHYTTDVPIPVVGIDAGPDTDVLPGTTLQWESQRPGVGPTAVVGAGGLTGGRAGETVGELRARIQEHVHNQPGNGNDGAIVEFVEGVRDVSAQKAFVYSGVPRGTGTSTVVFTTRPAMPGAGRTPNETQMAIVQAALPNVFNFDDGIFVAALVAHPVKVQLGIAWHRAARGWADAIPWPRQPTFIIGNVIDANTFEVFALNDHYYPIEGASFALYDRVAGKFRRRTIATLDDFESYDTGVPGYVLRATLTLVQSSDSYVPSPGDGICPWSDSLNQLVPPIASYFEKLGPGEQVASPYDEGYRERRMPEPGREWSDEISLGILDGVFDLAAVRRATLLSPTVPYATPIGIPGVSSNLLELRELLAFPA